jgi:hypothetical protein
MQKSQKMQSKNSSSTNNSIASLTPITEEFHFFGIQPRKRKSGSVCFDVEVQNVQKRNRVASGGEKAVLLLEKLDAPDEPGSLGNEWNQPGKRTFPEHTLMMTNIPSHATEAEIEEIIDVLEVEPKIKVKKIECSRLNEGMMTNEGFGYLTLENGRDVLRLVSMRELVKVKNQIVKFEDPISKDKMRRKMDMQRQHQIYVRGLNKTNGKVRVLEQFFKNFGKIRDIHLATHYKSLRFLGFAVIEFASIDTVNKILKNQNEMKYKLKGKTIKCQRKLLKAEIDKSRGSFKDSKYFAGNSSRKSSHNDSLKTPKKLKKGGKFGSSEHSQKSNPQKNPLKRKTEEKKDYWITKLDHTQGSPEILGSTIRKGSWKKHDIKKTPTKNFQTSGTKASRSQFHSDQKYSTPVSKQKKISCFSTTNSTKKLTTKSQIFKFPPISTEELESPTDLTNPLKLDKLSPTPLALAFKVGQSSTNFSPLLKPPSPNYGGKQSSSSFFNGFGTENRRHKYSTNSVNSVTSVHSTARLSDGKSMRSSGAPKSEYNPFRGCAKASFDSFLELREKNRRKVSEKL